MPVSVIVTCFNLDRYIGPAIQSVLSQDYSGDVEIIVVDDCSTDESAAAIRAIDNVRYIRTKRNCGVLLATLQGMEQAAGDCIFFLDGDDLWEAGKLAACMPKFESDPACVLVTHDLCFVDADGRRLQQRSRPAEVLGAMNDEERSAAIIDGLQRNSDFIWLGSAWGVRRSAGRLGEFVGWARRLPDPNNTYQDWPMAMWLASLPGARAAYVPEKLLRYRLHGANHSGDASSAAKAARNFMRTRNTVEAMRELAAERGLPADIMAVLGDHARANDYLSKLYSEGRTSALAGFPPVLSHFFRSGSVGKELVRLAGVQLLGADRFARWSAKAR